MPPSLPVSVLQWGPLPPPPLLALRAGPLDVAFDDGGLRHVRLGARELVRRVYVAVRDRNWDTVPARIAVVDADVRDDGFRLTCRTECRQDEIDFFWQGTITGDASGRISFSMDGRARTTFLRNRIGFCVLHPPEGCRGVRCRVVHSDGSVIHGRFPERIAPTNPFTDVAGLSHEVAPDLWCQVDFSGDAFEMEDQRNWGDASFKTFCTPLRRPFPVLVPAGSEIRQSVVISLEGTPPPPARRSTARTDEPIRIHPMESPCRPLPPIGLGGATHGGAWSARAQARLSALHLSHIRLDLPLAAGDVAPRLRAGWDEATALGVPLEVALFVSPDAETELAALAREAATIRPRVCRWLVLPVSETAAPDDRWCRLARCHLTAITPDAWFGTGTDHSFVEINRRRPDVAGCDFLCFSMNPQVHAADHRSIIETVETLGELVASARTFAGSTPLVVSPITLKMRSNPAATGPGRTPAPGDLPASVDARQPSLFAAAWTLGAIKHLAESGVASLTLFETTGWRGVMEAEAGSPLPRLFHSVPGGVYPMYHVLADLGEYRGGVVIPCVSTVPLAVTALVLEQDGRRRVLVANFSTERSLVSIDPGLLGGHMHHCVRLNAGNVLAAMQSPREFRQATREVLVPTRKGLTLELEPCELLRLDGCG